MFSKLKMSDGRARSAILFVALSSSNWLALAVSPAAAEPWPSRVDATYRIAFNGFDIGRFEFRADISGSSYTVSGNAQISALLGAFKWEGASRTSGALAGSNPRPAGYTFDFNGVGKSGAIKLGFQRGNVTSVSALPPAEPLPDVVPIRDADLKSVFDPLSAVLAISRPEGGNPCARRIPIFDGKQRFDLAFSFLRQQAIGESRPSGQPGVAIVCRVRFIPIAGHRATDEARHMASTEGIEVAFRPVPSAAIHVPYLISIPTVAGSATLTSDRINIVTRNEQIALTN
ncbi:MAG: DUF3108 domain-containing protein [Hyphomicrobiaceae bacterium]